LLIIKNDTGIRNLWHRLLRRKHFIYIILWHLFKWEPGWNFRTHFYCS